MPFFSVVIPVYNREKLISSTIQSVLNQSFADYELIIVDDGSTDGTKKAIESYENSKIKYIYQENGERGKARNTGVKNAIGSYVFFLDSDDLVYPDFLAHAHSEITRLDQPEFFHSRYEEKIGEHLAKKTKLLHEKTLFNQVIKQNPFACQFFLKRSVALEFPFSENRNLKIGEDWEVILKIAVRYPLHFSNEIQSALIQHEGRTMQMAEGESILLSLSILTENLKKDPLITPVILTNVFVELITLAALSFAIHYKRADAFKYWWKGIVKKPRFIFTRRTLAILKKIILGGRF